MAMKSISEYGGMCVGIWVENEDGEERRKGREEEGQKTKKGKKNPKFNNNTTTDGECVCPIVDAHCSSVHPLSRSCIRVRGP